MTNNKKTSIYSSIAQSLARDEVGKERTITFINYIESNTKGLEDKVKKGKKRIKYYEDKKKYCKEQEEGWEDNIKYCKEQVKDYKEQEEGWERRVCACEEIKEGWEDKVKMCKEQVKGWKGEEKYYKKIIKDCKKIIKDCKEQLKDYDNNITYLKRTTSLKREHSIIIDLVAARNELTRYINNTIKTPLLLSSKYLEK